MCRYLIPKPCSAKSVLWEFNHAHMSNRCCGKIHVCTHRPKCLYMTTFAKMGLISAPFQDIFLSPFNSHINVLTIHVCINTKNCSVCFYWGWFTSHVRHPWVSLVVCNSTIEKAGCGCKSLHDYQVILCNDLEQQLGLVEAHRKCNTWHVVQPTTTWLPTAPTNYPI